MDNIPEILDFKMLYVAFPRSKSSFLYIFYYLYLLRILFNILFDLIALSFFEVIILNVQTKLFFKVWSKEQNRYVV